MTNEPATITNNHEVTNPPTVSPRTQEVEQVTNTQVSSYSQSVLDYQGRANGFLTYAKGTAIYAGIITTLLPFILPFLFEVQEPVILTPAKQVQVEENITS